MARFFLKKKRADKNLAKKKFRGVINYLNSS